MTADFYSLVQLYRQDKSAFFDIANCGSSGHAYMHINKRSGLGWKWANQNSLDIFEADLDNLPELNIIVDKSDKNIHVLGRKKIFSYNKTNDSSRACSYIQRIKIKGKWTWLVTHKQIISKDDFINLTYPIDKSDNISKHIVNNLDKYLINDSNWLSYQSLSKREKEILFALLRFDSIEHIADSMFIAPSTARKHLEKIRYKTTHRSILSLAKYAEAFDIIGAER